MTEERLRYLLRRYYGKTASPEERGELMGLLREGSYDEEIRYLILELIRNENSPDARLESERAEDILKNIFRNDPQEYPGEEEMLPGAGPKWLGGRIGRYWAAAILVVGVSLGAYQLLVGGALEVFSIFRNDEVTEDTSGYELTAGRDRALLTLWDGTVISLDTTEQQHLYETADFKIDASKGELVYRGGGRKTGYNLLTTPLGGQYKVVLPDGSVAWLNAGSSLRFPTTFDPGSRKVEVTGEVFFDVKHKRNNPFVVTLPYRKKWGEAMEIVVLGTEFNVSSYQEDPSVQTTLVKGSVRVMKGNESKVLAPGEQAEIRTAEVGDSRIEVKNVDAESIAAWKEGRFEFSGKNMEEIMRQIARWYAVEVTFEKEELRFKEFLGAVSRKENAAEVLKVLEMTGGIRFEIKGQKINVKPI